MPYNSLIPRTIVSLVQPAVYAVAARLFVLTTDRRGSRRFKPSISTFFETGLVTSLYEQLLMSPRLSHLDVRHEMPFSAAAKGRQRQVDIWLRPVVGGYAHCVEAGDFSVGKAHSDARKLQILNPRGSNWFLAFFRHPEDADDPFSKIQRSFGRQNGLDPHLVTADEKLTRAFQVYLPNGSHDPFGFSLFKVAAPSPSAGSVPPSC